MRRRYASWKGASLLLILVPLIVYEEIYHAKLRFLYKNYYRKTVFPKIIVQRTRDLGRVSIAVITVLLNRSNFEEYRLAQETFECYALYHGYKWIVVDLSADRTFEKFCPQNDFLFLRHCVTAQIMEEERATEWFLFIDADMGVINPNHLIEEWIDSSVNIIFYNRIFNHEVMAGSYIAKSFFAEILDIHGNFFGFGLTMRRNCQIQRMVRTMEQYMNYNDLSVYEACVRNITTETPIWPGKLRILPKGEAWARDTWLTDSMWSTQDFILHGWQRRKIDGVMFAGWPSPFSSHEFNISSCTDDGAVSNWKYKDTFVRSSSEVRSWLKEVINYAKHEYEKALKVVEKYRNDTPY